MSEGKESKEAEEGAHAKNTPAKTSESAVKSGEVATPTETKDVKTVPKTEKKGSVVVSDATPAQVVKVFRKVGLYGECYQVLVRVLEGRDKGNLLRRNVRGPVKENDLLMLKETERDVRAV